MNHTTKSVFLVGSGVGAGLALALVVAWNPLHIARVDTWLGREGAARPATGHEHVLASPGGDSEKSDPRQILYWRAPMDPNYISDEPGTSPMGMELVPVYADEQVSGGGVRVSPNFVQNFAVHTTPVIEGSVDREVRTVGVLGHNEEKLFSINTKFEGWIERARFNTIGERVSKGDVLFEIYSPQLVTTQQEYLTTLQYVDKLSERNAYPDALERARSLLAATRERLRYWDMTEAQIDTLRRSGKANRTVELSSPVSGFVVEKMGDSLEGMRLTPGMTVLKIADHSTLWAEVEFYERDLRFLREQQRVTVGVDAFPERTWTGRILFFDPSLNQETRTLKGYIEIANSDLKLRPNMFVTVSMRTETTPKALLIPEQAVIHSGRRSVAIIKTSEHVFEPREIELGMVSDGMQEVLSGLSLGEVVVTSSQFLIDSESNLKASINQMLGEKTPGQKPLER